MKYLITFGAEAADVALHNSIKTEDNAFAKWLIENGSPIDIQDEYGYTPLHWAVRKGDIEIVKCLIEIGALLDVQNVKGITPLHIAIYTSAQIAKLFIDKGANVNARLTDKGGYTPLHCAAANGSLEIVKFLVESGAQIDARNKFNETPAMVANLNHEIEEYLTEKEVEKETANVPEEVITNKVLCIVCLAPRNGFYILTPCNHSSLCKLCCVKIKGKNCPTCRIIIQNFNKIYFQ